MTVTVLTQPGCMPCLATERALEKLGIDYVAVNIREDPDAAREAAALGHRSTPVVLVKSETDELLDHWSELRMDRIRALAA